MAAASAVAPALCQTAFAQAAAGSDAAGDSLRVPATPPDGIPDAPPASGMPSNTASDAATFDDAFADTETARTDEAGAMAAAQPQATAIEADPSAPVAAGDDSLAEPIPMASGPARPAVGPNELYGPPTPKVDRGQLPIIGWSEPPALVPPALDEAVHIVTRNYPSAQAARSALRAAHSDVRSAKWQRFPSIDGNVSYLDDTNSPQPQISVEQPIWAGGRITANIRRAKAEEDVTSAQYVETVQSLALTVTQVYYEIARLTLRQQLLAESLAEHRRLVETMERRVAQEVSPQADLELARSRAAQIEQEYTVSRASRETNLRILAQLVADPSYDLGPIPHFDPSIDLPAKESLEEQAVAFDPQINRRKAEADVNRAQLDLTQAQILPQVSAQYSYSEIYGSRVGVVLRSQTSGGLSNFSDVSSARQRIQTAIENVRVAEQELRRNVAADIINFEAAKARAAISSDAALTSARVSESYTRQFIAGRRSWLDVMNALREAVNNAIGQTDAEMTALATAAKLLLESGRWRPIFADQAEVGSNAEARTPIIQETGQ
ncbi:hypothetical protein B2G71_13135 [Novosphingobium sp. PC22D]|nr:hypothetical protein B2G71_13135 [Novosphingobium sp. PC22D]